MSLPELDLDAPAPERPQASGRPIPILAVALAGLVVGMLAGSASAPAQPARFLPAATLSAGDLYLDPTAPAMGSRLGRPVIELRLQVDNPGTTEIRLGTMVLDGVSRQRTVLPLNHPVPAQGSATVAVPVSPDCRAGQQLRTLLARVSLTQAHQEAVPAVTTGALKPLGGLCSLLDLRLPRGWRTPILAGPTAREGTGLRVTVEDLTGLQAGGLKVGDRLLSTVQVGARTLSSSTEVRPGRSTVLRLSGPPPCIRTGEGGTAPVSLRLLARGAEGLEERLIVIGPELTRWLRQGCSSATS
jgi:hypothetical protein